MPRAYPREFRDDVVRVARNRESGVTIEQIAADFGIHPMTLSKWMRQATDTLTKTIVKPADLLPKLQSKGIVLINADGTVAGVGDLAQTRVEHHKALVLQRS